MATFGWSYKSNASGSKRPREQARKFEEWQKNRPDTTAKPLHPQSHTPETLNAGTPQRKRKYDPRAKIFVGNLDWKTKEVTLAEYFSTFGEIEAVKVVKDHETGTSRGFAFITFSEADSAAKCKSWCAYNELKIDDRKITVRTAERRQTQHSEVEKKRKGVNDNNPTLYWEYKWTEDGEAEFQTQSSLKMFLSYTRSIFSSPARKPVTMKLFMSRVPRPRVATVYGPYETSLMLQWSKAGYFDAGCWVRQSETKQSPEDKSEPKRGRLVDQCYSDSSDSDDDTASVGDPQENDFVHVSEIDFSMFP